MRDEPLASWCPWRIEKGDQGRAFPEKLSMETPCVSTTDSRSGCAELQAGPRRRAGTTHARTSGPRLTASLYDKWLPVDNPGAVDRLDSPELPQRGSTRQQMKKGAARAPCISLMILVGARGFEPPTSWSRTCSSGDRLQHSETLVRPRVDAGGAVGWERAEPLGRLDSAQSRVVKVAAKSPGAEH